MKNRVVITGLGAITPVGLDAPSYWSGIKSGQSGVAPITRFDPSSLPVRFAAEVKGWDPTAYMSAKDAKRNARFVQFAVGAGRQAFDHAKLASGAMDMARIGVIVGSGMGALDVLEEEITTLNAKGPSRVSPFLIPMTIVNMAAGALAIQVGAKGPNYCPVSACASGSHAIGEAFRTLQRGDADAVLAGGAEAVITRLGISGFASAKALSRRNDDPVHASRPFDAARDGFVMGEGAGVMVLETLEHATRRGAEILAEVLGYGLSGDAYHMTLPAPEAEGAQRAIKMALADAGISAPQIDYINAHGTSTEANDRLETAAIKAVFGEHAARIPMSSTKSMTGHLLGAAGAIEAIATIMAIRDGVIPPTINLVEPDPECDLDYVPGVARPHEVRIAMSNNMGFGGQNGSLVFGRFQG